MKRDGQGRVLKMQHTASEAGKARRAGCAQEPGRGGKEQRDREPTGSGRRPG